MHLVRQMLRPGSAIAKLKHEGEEKHLFVRMGVFNMVLVALIGPLSTLFEQRRLISVVNISMLFSSPLLVSGGTRGCVTHSRADRPSGLTANTFVRGKVKMYAHSNRPSFHAVCTCKQKLLLKEAVDVLYRHFLQ